MKRHFIPILIVSLSLNAAEPVLDFYRSALQTLKSGQITALETRRGESSISAEKTNRFSNLSLDATYTYTKADQLSGPFNMTTFALSDSLDLFGKRTYTIETLRLETLGNQRLIDARKQTLYISLIDMITAYRKGKALYGLHQSLYTQQDAILGHLKTAAASGNFARMDAERFSDALALLLTQLTKEKNALAAMREQLKLYAPQQRIPSLDEVALNADQNAFLAHEPTLQYTVLHSRQIAEQASGVSKGWVPDVVVGAAYQFNNDPTSYGDNYALNAGIHMGFGGGIAKQAESLRVSALQTSLQSVQQTIEVKQRYIALRNAFETAEQLIEDLQEAEVRADKTSAAMQKAYLKHFVDFNAYLQTIQNLLAIKEQAIDARFQKIRSALILNALSSGVIYE